jgi:hypothetical protein
MTSKAAFIGSLRANAAAAQILCMDVLRQSRVVLRSRAQRFRASVIRLAKILCQPETAAAARHA